MIARLVAIGQRRPDGAAALALFLLPFAVLSPALLPGQVLSPAVNLFVAYPWSAIAPGPVIVNPALTDITQVFHPTLIYAAREIEAGRFPFWNPYGYAGVPFFSNPQTAMLFPLTALVYVLPISLALTLMSVLKLAAAGLGTYWFLRVLAVAPVPALVGALGFMLSSTLIGWLQWTFATTMIFIPLLFGVVERLRQTDHRRFVAALAVVVGLDVLAGYPQGTLHAFLAAAAWALWRAPGPGGLRFLGRCGAGVTLGAGLAAVQVLPFLDYVPESAVYAYRSQWTPVFHVPVEAAVTFLLPEFFGRGVESWGLWQFNIMTTYVGLVPVVALPVALVAAGGRSATRFFVALTAVVAAVHYGAPVVSALASVPGMSLGTNLRLMPLLVFAVSTLGALGLDAVARGAGRASPWPGRAVRGWFVLLVAVALAAVAHARGDARAEAMTYTLPVQYLVFVGALGVVALVVLGWLGERRSATRWGLAVVGLELATVLPLAATYNPAVDRAWLYPVPPAIAWLQERATDHSRVLMPGDVGLLYGLAEAHGYDGMTPRRIEQVIGSVGTGGAILRGFLENPVALHGSEPLGPAIVLASPAIDLLGVRWIALPPKTAPLWPHLVLAYDGEDARVFRNDRALPRAFVVAGARCADDVDAVHLIREQRVDPRREVLLAGCAMPPLVGPAGAAGAAEIVEYGTDRVVIAAATDVPAFLVLTDTWFPGWRAWVDGQEADVWRADHAFRAVWLPPGRHQVEFRFRPRGLRIGLAVSAMAAALIVACVVPWRRRRAPS